MPPAKQRTARLRNTLLDHAVAGIEREGLAALQARRAAAAAGTSTAALYELFGDKQGLVRAVVNEGFRLLQAQLEAAPVSADARADLVALLAASRCFAASHPALDELMHSRPLAELSPAKDERRAAAGIYELVVARVARWLDGGSPDPVDAAHVLVALNGGLIARERAGVLGSSAKTRNHRWRLAVDVALDGLAQRSA